MSNVKRMDDHLLAKAIMAVYRINDLLDSIYAGSEKTENADEHLEEACKILEQAAEKLRMIKEKKHE
jgi:hypothetical protein